MIYFISPGWNCSKYIKGWYSSIRKTVDLANVDYRIIAVNDCSTDNSLELLKKIAKENERVCLLNNEENCGPAYSRWRAFDYVKKKDSSICINLDMDDYLTENALSIILQNYSSQIKMTMGSIVNYTKKEKFYSKKDIDENLFTNYSRYRGLAPLTYRASLIKNFDSADFQDSDGNWLHYCSDVALTFSLLFQISSSELSNIHKGIYIYNIRRDGTMLRFGDRKTKMYKHILKRFNKRIKNEKVL